MNAAKLKERCGALIVGTVDFVHAAGTMSPMADPNADYWTVDEVADHWGVAPQTIRTYRSRKRGELPEPDRMFGRSPVWRPKTIIEFQRPGQGARTDLKPADDGSAAESNSPQ
ncbi:helix-turn-helix transcriptional regulator [Streptomyces sp. NPDC102476]|uniref:helix-turn-helix transcriptional regulator n=1 Tax=Streptomyces sp. NPDC102476 TaxID=3366181 RepID=UPI0038030357